MYLEISWYGASLVARISRVLKLMVVITLDGISCLDAGMLQDALGVFEGSVLLQVCPQCPPHYLERDKVPGNAELLCNGADSPFDKVSPRRQFQETYMDLSRSRLAYTLSF